MPATKLDLLEFENKYMATQAELALTLNDVLAQQVKTQGEIAGVQVSVDVLKQQVIDLQAALDANANASQQLVDAVAAVKAQAQIIDDQIPDVVPTPVVPA